jgi:hypothetical protein
MLTHPYPRAIEHEHAGGKVQIFHISFDISHYFSFVIEEPEGNN